MKSLWENQRVELVTSKFQAIQQAALFQQHRPVIWSQLAVVLVEPATGEIKDLKGIAGQLQR